MNNRIVWILSLVAAVCWLSSSTALAQSNKACLSCHDDSTLVKEVNGKQISMNVDPKKMKGTVHADLDCVDCHKGVKPDDPHTPRPGAVSCKSCHEEQVAAYDTGRHASAPRRGDDRAATCNGCHGSAHEILPSKDPKSKTWRGNIPHMCGECHGQKFAMAKSGISTRSYQSYQESVHGAAVADGKTRAAVCTDCHKSHDVRTQDDPASPIFRSKISKTCGNCHKKMAEEYDTSVHGKAVARGSSQSPSCSDCHGIHLIKAPENPSSSVASQKLSQTCGKCHESVRLSQEFGVRGDRLSTYGDSYHGMASVLGAAAVANCASCHGVHNILPSDDTNSTIHPRNLAHTCGTCHPGAAANFIQGKVHLTTPSATPAAKTSPGSGQSAAPPVKASTEDETGVIDWGSITTDWVRQLYMVLIAGTIGGMLLHNFLGWRRHVIEHVRNSPRSVERLTRNHRMQHYLLIGSFVSLVITGFALKYPTSIVAWILGSSELIRRTGHRAAAIVMVVVAVYHVFYLLCTAAGRRDLRDMWPRWKDVTDLIGNLRYWLDYSSTRPKMARFGYPEKAEYWALAWGTVIMAITGFMLWFPVQALFGFLPRWTIDVATAIHFYEAILASLAIPVWHFYHVMLSPEVYPLNYAFLDGHISEEQYRHEHALAWEEMQEEAAGAGTPEASEGTTEKAGAEREAVSSSSP